jgi:hypothetical protein
MSPSQFDSEDNSYTLVPDSFFSCILLAVLFDMMDANGDLGLDRDELMYLLRAMNEGNSLFRDRNVTSVLNEFDR